MKTRNWSLGDRATQVRFLASLAAAKVTRHALRISGKGGGTAAPGLVATAIDPMMLRRIASNLPSGAIVVAGTNGKTTTSRLIADMLTEGGYTVVNNRAGSNLVRGVAAELAGDVSLAGKPQSDIAVIEADEAAFPAIVDMVRPRAVVLTNLFRDQLDRYGELNAIATRWRPALRGLDSSPTVIVNVDDPRLSGLSEGLDAGRLAFGLEPGSYALDELPHAADRTRCEQCGSDLEYRTLSVSHLGDWYCPGCGESRPARDLVIRDLTLRGTSGSSFLLDYGDDELCTEGSLPGIYNAYNVVAAAAAARAIGVGLPAIDRAIRAFVAPFGRIDRIQVGDKSVVLILIKNPTGCNEVLRMLNPEDERFDDALLVVINDLDADGRDISWLWDTDFELLTKGDGAIATAGLRAADMANRLKYAGVDQSRISLLNGSLRDAFYRFVDQIPVSGTGHVVATYTATIELRAILASDGVVDRFWEQ